MPLWPSQIFHSLPTCLRRKLSSQLPPLVDKQRNCTHALLLHQVVMSFFQHRHCRSILTGRWHNITCWKWSPSIYHPSHWQMDFRHLQDLHSEEPCPNPGTSLWTVNAVTIFLHPHSGILTFYLLSQTFISFTHLSGTDLPFNTSSHVFPSLSFPITPHIISLHELIFLNPIFPYLFLLSYIGI